MDHAVMEPQIKKLRTTSKVPAYLTDYFLGHGQRSDRAATSNSSNGVIVKKEVDVENEVESITVSQSSDVGTTFVKEEAGDHQRRTTIKIVCSGSSDAETPSVRKVVKRKRKPARKTAKCEICNQVFYQKYNLKQHLSRGKCEPQDNSVVGRNKKKCIHPNCDLRFFHIKTMIKHLESHDDYQKVESQKLDFSSMSDFKKWKAEEESETYSYFCKASGDKKLKYTYYVCHYDGSDRYHKALNAPGRRTPRKWKKGRIKTGLVCPSRMNARENSDGSVSVTYFRTHTHKLDSENLKHQPISDRSLEYIKSRLALGIPAEKIEKEIHECYGDHSEGNMPIKRDFLASVKSIKAIKRRMEATDLIHPDDALAVQMLIHDLRGEAFDPVLCYKPQGCDVVIGCEDSNLLPSNMDKNLFFLGIQTKDQLEMLKEGAHRVVYVCITRNLDQYDFNLINFFVKDELGNGYPVAHFITNHSDEETFASLFRTLESRCPNIRINILLADNNADLYNAFAKVFRPQQHLLCHSNLIYNWEKVVVWLVPEEYEKEARNSLFEILQEKNESEFNDLVSKFKNRFNKICPKFVEFMETYYFKDNVTKWASWYRNFEHANTDSCRLCNSFICRLRKEVRRNDQKRLESLLGLLIDFERMWYFDYKRRVLCKTDSPSYTTDQMRAHQKGMRIKDEEVTFSEGVYTVVSRTDKNKMYQVTNVSQVCHEDFCFNKCVEMSCKGLCNHMYQCTCSDVNICRHIHKVHVLSLNGMPKNACVEEESIEVYDCEIQVLPEEETIHMIEDTEKGIEDMLEQLHEYWQNPLVKKMLTPYIPETLNNMISSCEAVVNMNEC